MTKNAWVIVAPIFLTIGYKIRTILYIRITRACTTVHRIILLYCCCFSSPLDRDVGRQRVIER